MMILIFAVCRLLNLPTPTDEQNVCIDQALQTQLGQDITDACGDGDITSLMEVSMTK